MITLIVSQKLGERGGREFLNFFVKNLKRGCGIGPHAYNIFTQL